LRPEQRPRGGLLGEVAWGTALSLYECFMLGQHAWWWQLHFGLWRAYIGWNPDKVLAELPESDYRDTLAYGETPASSVLKMLEICRRHFPHAESLLDLGAGRGVLAMTAAANHWEVLALEYLQEFITRSEPLTVRLGWPVQWVKGDFLVLPFPPCDVVHVAATAYPEQTRHALADKLAAECTPEQAIMAQDWILDEERFEAIVGLRLPVTWGSSYFTLHRRRSALTT
jgi:hypothetical protein